MAAFISVLIVLALANCARCLRFAYISARDLNDGGYPIYGDAIHNGMILGFAAWFSGLIPNFYTPYQRTLGWSALAMLILNVWLIGRFVKTGDRRREEREKSVSA